MPKFISSPTQCFVWEKWEMIRLQLGRTELNGIRRIIMHADGVRVGNIPRIHDVELHREGPRCDERLTVWTWAVQLQDHLHVNVSRHYMERKKGNTERGVNTIQRQVRIMLANSIAVVGSEKKRCGIYFDKTRRILAQNCRTNDGEFLRIRSPDISWLQCFWERRSKK